MGCIDLMSGLDISCLKPGKFYYQNVILVNKEDVDQFNIYTTNKNSMNFNLQAGKCGFLFASNEKRRMINANFSKKERNNVVFYDHKVDIPIVGTDEEIKVLLRELDEGEFFGAVQHIDGNIEIYGFEYGLKTNSWNYEAQSGMGGSIISLSSQVSEEFPPFNYLPNNPDPGNTIKEQAIIDFDNLFCDLDPLFSGDFNNDYNTDFYITN